MKFNLMSDIYSSQVHTDRLLSLDFFRGLTMFLLIGSGTQLYDLMMNSDNRVVSWLGNQFEHPEWIGIHFWDFVEPFFMFIVGVAIPYSVMKRLERGDTWKKLYCHAAQRSVILFFLGIAYYSVSAGRPVFKLWNVLTQLSFTYILAFLLMRKTFKIQILVSLGLLLITELLYRLWPIEGFNHAFVADQNFGTWVDLKLMGRIEKGHWVAFNAVPTAAFTIWGVLTGQILQSDRTSNQKLKTLIIAGVIGIFAGIALCTVTPFIKKTGTSSIILETGGWCLIAMALSYWVIDIKKIWKIPLFFAIVGMNPLFIYLFAQVGGGSFLSHLAKPFVYGLFFWAGTTSITYLNAILTWFFLWYICYFFYRNKIFIKI
jgi:predicted acyltransferase